MPVFLCPGWHNYNAAPGIFQYEVRRSFRIYGRCTVFVVLPEHFPFHKEHIEQSAIMAALHDPPVVQDLPISPVLPSKMEGHIVVAAVRLRVNLPPDALLHLVVLVGTDQIPEAMIAEAQEIRQIPASGKPDQLLVGKEDMVIGFIRFVNEERTRAAPKRWTPAGDIPHSPRKSKNSGPGLLRRRSAAGQQSCESAHPKRQW